MKCKRGYEIQTLKSAAGWYLGTVDEEGFPNCRISTQYAETAEQAENLPMNRQTGCIENEYCNEGTGCFVEYEYDNEYTPSATRGDYSPSNPWDAPGMSMSDFI